MNILYRVFDIFFFAFHISLILFNLFGWIFKSLRRWNLLTLTLTVFSWVVLGFFYGFGYCFLTDWHWQIREKLGYTTNSNSYIHFLITSLFPISISENTVNWLTGIFFFIALILSLLINTLSVRKRG
jgi:hypothetical protein